MASIPAPSLNWTSPYAFTASSASGTFNISATGDGTTVSVP